MLHLMFDLCYIFYYILMIINIEVMAHCRLLFVGSRQNLQQIFFDCQDSSSETAAEMTIGADWVADWDYLSEDERKLGWTTDDFTKDNKELYKQILDGKWYECFDIRDVNHYGAFACINCPDFEPFNNGEDWKGKEERNKIRTIEAIKKLPENTVFYFADSHW